MFIETLSYYISTMFIIAHCECFRFSTEKNLKIIKIGPLLHRHKMKKGSLLTNFYQINKIYNYNYNI
jgi:hypothetical protein